MRVPPIGSCVPLMMAAEVPMRLLNETRDAHSFLKEKAHRL